MNNKIKLAIILFCLLLSSVWVQAEVSRRVFRNYSAADGLADNSAQIISCTKTGRLVIATMGQINFYDGQRFVYIDPTDENVFPLKSYRGNYHLYFDSFHHIWLKNTFCVTCVDLLTERFVASVENELRKFGVEKQVNDLFVDQNGIVWLLTDDGLYNVKTRQTLKVRKDLNLQDLEVYKDKQLLLFFEDGLVEMLDLSTGKKIHESYAYGEVDRERYRNSSVLKVDENRIFQIRNGNKDAVLNCFDVDRREWSEILRTPYHLNNMAQRDSILFVPSEYGYWGYNILSKELRHAENLQLENGQVLNTDINVMCFDRQGGLWAGTEKRGLLYSMPYRSPFKVYSWNDKRAGELAAMMEDMDQSAKFRNRSVNCVVKDSRGWTWVGTSQGLQLYRKFSDMLPQIFTKKDGMLNNVVHSIVEDKQHCIWVTTSYGITCIQVVDGKVGNVMSYNRYDHIPNEMFVNGKAMCLPDGEIVMQALDHVVAFYPERMSKLEGAKSFELYPKLIRMLVNGNDISTGQEYGGKVILEKAISRTSEIDLNYDQNSASLVFSALNFFRPQQTCYRVRIKGLIDDWKVYTTYDSGGLVDSKGLFHLPLMSLRPGTYTIELQASMLPDKWNTKPYEWIVRINEPWWRTTGLFAIMGVVLFLLLIANAYFFQRNSNLRAQRNRGEQAILNRICTIAKRVSVRGEILLEPTLEEMKGNDTDVQDELDSRFVAVMEKILPFVNTQDQTQLSMRMLSSEANLDIQDFYRIISENIYKSPRALYRKMMLDQATELLKNRYKPVDEIAEECGFVSPNYFIATFFRAHQMTPAEYRGTL